MRSKTSKSNRPNYVMYLAVLPKYRTDCISLLDQALKDELSIFVSSAHLDSTVRTGIPSHLFRQVKIYRLMGNRFFIQIGGIGKAIRSNTTVLDLNPRSLTAWTILLCRSTINRRSILWGHIHPRAGDASKTAFLRRWMRRLADGTITYTYEDAAKAQQDEPGRPVWTAPNSLYRGQEIHPDSNLDKKEQNSAIYVGRFEESKKVLLLVRGFRRALEIEPQIRLLLVGGGSTENQLRDYVRDHGLTDKIEFAGWIDDIDDLRRMYGSAFCSVSPGFAGLGLTQSLGFGVPMIIADKEPHSPEIELAHSGGVHFFGSDSPEALALALVDRWKDRAAAPSAALSEYVRDRYSAESMSGGLLDAMRSLESESRR